MLEEVKKIKLEELNKQKEEYYERENNLNKRCISISLKLYNLQEEQQTSITIRDKFSFLEKWITRRNDYKKFKAQDKRFLELPKLIEDVKDELAKETTKVEQEIKTLGIRAKIKGIEDEIGLIKNAKTLYEIGITPTVAIELLENKGIEPVLTKADKNVFLHPRDYSSKSSLIGVHKTKYAPKANMIKSAKDSKVKVRENIKINGVEYTYSFESARDTVHMAMNDEVSSHMMGSWDDCKYAILIPFEDIKNEKIGRAAPIDTFTRGSLELTENAWILCPKKEVNILKEFNPKVHVLGYEGENVQGYSKPFLTQLGYRGEEVETWKWSNQESEREYYKLMEKEKLKRGLHTFTYFHEDEQILGEINEAVELSKLLRNIQSRITLEDSKKISKIYGDIFLDLCTKSKFTEDIDPQSIKGNNKQVDVFFGKMKDNNFNTSLIYQNIMKKLAKVSIDCCNKDKQDEVFNIPREASEEEKRTIEKLESIIVSNEEVDEEIKENMTRLELGKFLLTAIGQATLHSQKRENLQEDKSL